MSKDNCDEHRSQVRMIKWVASNHQLSQPANIEVGKLALPKTVSEGTCHESMNCCPG